MSYVLIATVCTDLHKLTFSYCVFLSLLSYNSNNAFRRSARDRNRCPDRFQPVLVLACSLFCLTVHTEGMSEGLWRPVVRVVLILQNAFICGQISQEKRRRGGRKSNFLIYISPYLDGKVKLLTLWQNVPSNFSNWKSARSVRFATNAASNQSAYERYCNT
jgi:hypothetical protein